MKHYHFYEEEVEGVLFQFILPKKAQEDDIVKVMLQVHMNVYTDMGLKIVHRTTGEVLLEDKFLSGKEKSVIHDVFIEIDGLEGDYKSLKKVGDQNSEKVEMDKFASVKGFKNKMSQHGWKIIDWDGFLKGNYIIPEFYNYRV